MLTEKDWVSYFRQPHYNLFNVIINQQRLIESIMKYTPKNGKIIEIGCGSGFTSILLDKTGYKVTAIDSERQVTKLASNKAKDTCSHINIISMDMRNLCFENNSVDTVFHQGVLEHFDDETIIEALREQRRVARVVIFDVPNNKYRLGRYNVGNERLLSIKHWKELISEAGLRVIDIKGRGYVKLAYVLPLFIVKRLELIFSSSSIFICKRRSSAHNVRYDASSSKSKSLKLLFLKLVTRSSLCKYLNGEIGIDRETD